MKYTDRLYGTIEISEPLLLALLRSQAVQRLAGVLQHGVTALIGITRPVSRLEHSLGVMLLVKQFGGDLEEQVAALLHDVSHTAFSHVIDYVFDDHEAQGYHERMKEPCMAGSDLPRILARYDYDWRTFLHEERFSLLEQPAPALCADRLDYFLRDSLDLGLATLEEVRWALAHLVVHEGQIVCDNVQAARWMAEAYLAADQASWANFREVGLYELMAQALKVALRQGVIADADLWTTDAQVWTKLQSSVDPHLRATLALVSAETRFARDERSPDFWVSTKLRTIDPQVRVDGSLARLSELEPAFARQRADYLQSRSGKWPMRVIR